MAGATTHYNFIKPDYSEYDDVANQNSNWDKVDEELYKRGTTVNGEGPDASGNYKVNEVPFARQIVTDDAQQSSGEFLFRTTGGDASLTDGPAKLVSIFGRSTHTGIVEESLEMTVNAVPREESESEEEEEDTITATIDRDTFVAYVATSGTITLSYTNAWSANPALYGVTVTGTPVSGDQIVIVYVKENRGTITNSNPSRFVSTGWNLYNHTNTYARVKKYSSTYGFLVGGTYTKIEYSATLTGEKTTITPASGYFTVPDDGYVWVTGGNSTNTYILMTWSDWGEGYEGSWKAYSESAISLSTIMSNFSYGLMQVGGVADEINFSMGMAISRIERMAYSAENLEIAKASGRAWDADEDYIYIVRASEVTYTITETGDYTACDHGEEIIEGGTVPVFVQTLYGQNLVDKLRTDVLTKSADLVNNLTTNDSTKALSAAQGYALNSNMNNFQNAIVLTSSQNLMTVALDSNICPNNKVVYFDLRNSNNTDMPTIYGVGRVMKRNTNSPIITVFADNGTVWVRNYNGSSWSDWDQLALNSKITTNEVSPFFTIDSTKITLDASSNCHKTGNVICAVFDFTAKSGVSGVQSIGTIDSSIRPRKNIYGTLGDYTSKTTAMSFVITTSGNVQAYNLTANHEYLGSVCYLI